MSRTVDELPRIPLLDLKAQHAAVGESIRLAIEEVAASQQFILGPVVERFEQSAAAYLGARYAIAVSSGSDALVVALLALGVGPGDEVITTAFSFFATVESIVRVGATPRLVDILPDTYNIDPVAVEAAITPRTRVILAVHLYGQPARLPELMDLAARHGLALVEDAAQAFGARLRGRRLGTFGELGCFSFQPSKPLGAWGDAGLVVTDAPRLAEICRSLRSHGSARKHRHDQIGGNFRMDALQAAVLLTKLSALDSWLNARREHTAAYNASLGTTSAIVTPVVLPAAEPSGALYTIRVKNGRRDALGHHLHEQNIESAVYYPTPLHLQPGLERVISAISLPVAEAAAREVLSLPLYPELTSEMRERVVAGVRSFEAESSAAASDAG